jgi:hypothetical protein
MPEIHIANWAQIIVHASQEGSDRVTTHSIRTVPDITDPLEANAIAEAFWAQTGTFFRQAASNTVNFDFVEVRTMYPQPNNYQGIYMIPQPAPGTKASEATPANVAFGVKWRTGVRGRKHHGRNNLFGLTEGDTIGSTFTAAAVAGAVSVAASILGFNGASGITTDPVVASRVGQFLTEVFTFTLDFFVDSQRTRLLNRGD